MQIGERIINIEMRGFTQYISCMQNAEIPQGKFGYAEKI